MTQQCWPARRIGGVTIWIGCRTMRNCGRGRRRFCGSCRSPSRRRTKSDHRRRSRRSSRPMCQESRPVTIALVDSSKRCFLDPRHCLRRGKCHSDGPVNSPIEFAGSDPRTLDVLAISIRSGRSSRCSTALNVDGLVAALGCAEKLFPSTE